MCVHGAHKHMLFHVNKLTYTCRAEFRVYRVYKTNTQRDTKGSRGAARGAWGEGSQSPFPPRNLAGQVGQNLPLTLLSTPPDFKSYLHLWVAAEAAN